MFGAFGTLMILWAMAGAPRPRGKPVTAASPAPICSNLRRVVAFVPGEALPPPIALRRSRLDHRGAQVCALICSFDCSFDDHRVRCLSKRPAPTDLVFRSPNCAGENPTYRTFKTNNGGSIPLLTKRSDRTNCASKSNAGAEGRSRTREAKPLSKLAASGGLTSRYGMEARQGGDAFLRLCAPAQQPARASSRGERP